MAQAGKMRLVEKVPGEHRMRVGDDSRGPI
jgi:hypothetical protein